MTASRSRHSIASDRAPLSMPWRTGATLLGLLVALSACSSEPIGGVNPSGTGNPSNTSHDDDPSQPDMSAEPDDPAGTDDVEPPALLDDPADDGVDPDDPNDDPADPPDDADPTAPTGTTPTVPSQPDEPTVAPEALFPPRIRRMTNQEFEASVQSLLGTITATQPEFVPDARQSGFIRNEGQIVDPLFARQLQQTADALAAEFVSGKLSSALPCASAGDAACATTFFTEFLPRAFRRQVGSEEIAALVDGVYATGAAGGGFTAGMQLAISAALQSAAFIYHTELGDSSGGSATTLNADETAAQLAFLLTGGPPDAELLAAAADGSLMTAESRATQARRLLALPAARGQVVSLIEEWLGIDALASIGKDNQSFPQFETGLRESMLAETESFVSEVAFNQGGSLTTLLGADYTVADETMRQFYGVNAAGSDSHMSLAGTGRVGILNQAAFLARYATEIESAPIRRGVAVARKVMCIMIPDPAALDLAVVPPPPDPNKSVRERFEQHSSDEQCRACHDGIDAIGFSFEAFDAVGKHQDGQDSTAVMPETWMLDLTERNLTDSAHLASQLSASTEVKRCFTRNLTRFAGAASNTAVESYFLNTWQTLEATGQDSILEILVAYAASDVFVKRGATP